jgi:hypothetical protein
LLRLAVILATVAVVATHSLLFQQGANGQQELSIQVWLADVKPDTGMVQVCVDIPDTGASKCKKFDGSASKKESLGISSDPTIIDAGIYKLGLERAKENSTLIGCVYVFKDEILPMNETHAIMLFTKVKPVFYDKETGRLYRYGQCYFENESTKYCVEDEGIQYPQLKK